MEHNTTTTPVQDMPNVDFSAHYKAVKESYYGTSFDPEGRARHTIKTYEDQLRQDLAKVPAEHRAKYVVKYTGYFMSWISAQGRCISTMITGDSNFPVRRAEKANQSEHNRYEEFQEWRARTIAAMERSERRKNAPNELDQQRKQLESRKKLQELMKAANAAIRKHKNNPDKAKAALIELGIGPANAAALLDPSGSWWGTGFAAYELTNNNANIKRIEERIKLLEQKEQVKTAIMAGEAETPKIEINGVKIVKDYQADRVKVFFDGKPDRTTIDACKRAAFKWSQSNGCWQRQLTPAAFEAAKKLCQSLPMPA